MNINDSKRYNYPTKQQLEEMANTDIRTVDPDTLVDIESVTIRTDLPKEERILDYLQQIKNPYCYKYKGMVIKVSYAGKRKLEDCLVDCMFPYSSSRGA
jgi:hypothetical protein